MLLSVMHGACLILATALGADEPLAAPPRLKTTADAIPAVKKARHYLVQVKLIEVDEQGRETVLGEPKLQTTGGNAGLSIDHADGRRFEFTMKLTDRLGSSDELIPAKSVVSPTDGVIKKLDQKIDLSLLHQPRKDVLREISRRAGVSFAIDPESSREILAGMEVPIDIKVKDEAIASILDQVIEPLKLEYTVRHDVVLIAAAEKLVPLPEDFSIKTYHVADLVTNADNDDETPDLVPLIERIKAMVMPASWDRKQAAASIRSFNSTSSVVVRQTATGHAAIERFLDKIRRDPPMKISE
ncbi:MAG: hypothetical protein JWP89_5258 [Schlesneria sp.]|nr:hypothetical protein [Schlesneria sp.]